METRPFYKKKNAKLTFISRKSWNNGLQGKMKDTAQCIGGSNEKINANTFPYFECYYIFILFKLEEVFF